MTTLEQLKKERNEKNQKLGKVEKKIMEIEIQKKNALERLAKFGIKEEDLESEIESIQDKMDKLGKKIEAKFKEIDKDLTNVEEILNG